MNVLNSVFSYSQENIFKNRLVLAPMAGIGDAPFRKIVWEYDCGLLYSEMISAKAIVFKNPKTIKMLNSCISEIPVIVQIYGADPENMAQAARFCQDTGVRMLDINMGCPVHKVFKTGAGSALIADHKNSREIIRQIREKISIPLSIKIRSGTNKDGDDALGIAQIAQEEGVNLIAIHPRTTVQMFKGRSDWSVITRIKKSVNIPVVGNGDVSSADEALRMMKETGCDLVMIGRACLGKPWLFSEILNGNIIGNEEKYSLISRHLKYMIEEYGEENGVIIFRKHLLWYVQSFHRVSVLRKQLATVKTQNEIINLIKPYYLSPTP